MVHPKIKRMVRLMNEKPLKNPKSRQRWFLYILRCKDGSFYTGVTNNVERRLKMHSAGKASRYTRVRRPVQLIFQETCANRPIALARECAVKSLPREKKEELVNTQKNKRKKRSK